MDSNLKVNMFEGIAARIKNYMNNMNKELHEQNAGNA
jgi:hypothetical protein